MVSGKTSRMGQLYDAARTRAVGFRRSGRGRLEVTGPDRRAFLHALLTNDIAALGPGQGCYSAYLTPQGRMITDLFVYELGDRILLALDRSLALPVAERLDRLIFSEDVKVADISGDTASVAVVGPLSAQVVSPVSGIADEILRDLPEHASRPAVVAGDGAVVLRITDLGEPGYEIVVPAAHGEALEQGLAALDVPFGGDELAETLRIEAGLPRFLRDMDGETIPLEAGIETRAISMTKGCYVGQEVIVRVLHRGHGRVAEKLVMLEIDDAAVPPTGAELHIEGRVVGRVTSSAYSPAAGRPIALAYVQRDFIDPGTRLLVGATPAVVRGDPAVQRRVSS